MISRGKEVSWYSQSSGSVKYKTGKVIGSIPAGANVRELIPDDVKKSHIKFDKDVSKFDRVLVSVSAGKNGQIMHYYCPLESVLKSQGN